MNLDFTLSFADNQWVCSSDSFQVLADSLDEIDNSVENHIRKQYQKGHFTVKMFFDFDSFPRWHRQYMPHYFNREINFTLT